MKVGVLIEFTSNTDIDAKFAELKEMGVDSCQLVCWDRPTLHDDAMAEAINKGLEKYGIHVTYKIMEESPLQNYKARQTALLGMLFALSMALSFLESIAYPVFWPDARHEAGAFQYCCHVRRFVFEPPFGALSCAAQGVVCVAYPRRYSRVSFAVRGALSRLCSACFWHRIHHHRLHFFGQRGTGAQLRPAAGGCSAAFRQNGNHLCADAADSGSYSLVPAPIWYRA